MRGVVHNDSGTTEETHRFYVLCAEYKEFFTL